MYLIRKELTPDPVRLVTESIVFLPGVRVRAGAASAYCVNTVYTLDIIHSSTISHGKHSFPLISQGENWGCERHLRPCLCSSVIKCIFFLQPLKQICLRSSVIKCNLFFCSQ